MKINSAEDLQITKQDYAQMGVKEAIMEDLELWFETHDSINAAEFYILKQAVQDNKERSNKYLQKPWGRVPFSTIPRNEEFYFMPTERLGGYTSKILEEGTGASPKPKQRVAVHYEGKLEDGTVFDSSIIRQKPFVFQVGVGQVIAGWDRAILEMKVGEKVEVSIPPEMGYGSRAMSKIPANSTLIFTIELLEIENIKI